MHYLTYKGRTVNILKCSACRRYPLCLRTSRKSEPDEDWTTWEFTCESCGASGSVRISARVSLEAFETWEELLHRIDELKVAMTLTDLDPVPDPNNSD